MNSASPKEAVNSLQMKDQQIAHVTDVPVSVATLKLSG